MNWYRNSGDEKKKWTLDRRPNLPLNRPWNHYHLLEPVDWDHDGSEGGWIYFYKRQ